MRGLGFQAMAVRKLRGAPAPRGMSGLSLWIVLSFLLLLHLAYAADTTAVGADAWSILAVITWGFVFPVFGGVLLYYLDILSYHVIFRTGVYDMLRRELCELRRYDESGVRRIVYPPMAWIFKQVGLPFVHVAHSLLGSQFSVYWGILWELECLVYIFLLSMVASCTLYSRLWHVLSLYYVVCALAVIGCG